MSQRIFVSPAARALLRPATAYLTALAFDQPVPDVPHTDDDWLAACREVAGIHGIGPFLGLRVLAGEIVVPEPLAGWLAGQVQRNRERLTRLRSDLTETLAALRAAGIVTAPLKGAAMLLDGVEPVVWRSMGDLDLLVLGASERSLDLALAHAGYCLQSASWKHRRYGACAPGPPFVLNDGEHPDNPRDVEVHEAVVEMFRGFRWDLTSFLVAGRSPENGLIVLDPDAMALHLAVHASLSVLDGQARAIQMIDLARAIAGIDPSRLVAAARAAGIDEHARFIYPGVALSARETGSAWCMAAVGELEPFVTQAMVDWVRQLDLYDVSYPALADGPQTDRFAIWTDSPVERAALLLHRIAPSPATLAGHAHSSSGSLPVRYLRHYRHLTRRTLALAARSRSA